MDEDEITIFDVEAVILGGEMIERQKDKDTEEWELCSSWRNFG